MKRKYCLWAALWMLCMKAAATDVVWFDGQHPVTYQVVGKVDPVVEIALQMFRSDMEQVTGQPASPRAASPRAGRSLPSGQSASSRAGRGLPSAQDGLPATIRISQGKGSDDGFRLSVSPDGRQILVEGHNGRGAAYGLLELSRLAGVSPWVWWGDVVPEHRDRLTIKRDFRMEHVPSVAYRGIFINDEDWSLRRWASTTYEPTGQKGRIGPKTYKAIFQLLLRLRANTIWPAMHEGTTGFFTVEGNKQMADSCGILIGTSHCEPLLRNNVAEWDVKKRGRYNYITNREQVQQYWTERLQEVKGSEELFTIGMRGIHDGSMEGVKTAEEKLNGLQQVIDDQRELIRKHYRKDVERVPQVFIPYKEVLEILESGLRVPDDVTLMWCDDNYGYMTRLPDAEQQRRQGGGGVYYHLSYWGRPHDHLWLTTTQPGLIYSEMKAAYDHNCRKLWIANVHDPKVAAYDLEFFLDMAWDIEGIQPSSASEGLPLRKPVTIRQHLCRWLCTQFGTEAGQRLAPAMEDFYRLCAIRKPEFMGWTQVELDKKVYPGGQSTIADLGLTRREAADRLADFGRIKATVEACRMLVRPELLDAYFAHVVYPVFAAEAMTRKVVSEADESHRAYNEIQQLTDRYNALSGGKWKGLMDAAPRQLPVFADTRGKLVEDSLCADCSQRSGCSQCSGNPCQSCSYVARNAADYAEATAGCQSIQLLGHSMQAVAIPKGGTLTYTFQTDREGDATLYTAMIPTQPSDKGDLRYAVQIDDQPAVVISLKEKYRSEQWKLNVLRGQALKQTPVSLPSPSSPHQHPSSLHQHPASLTVFGDSVAKPTHTLRITALDDHIIADQWMLDFQQGRRFYVVPVKALP